MKNFLTIESWASSLGYVVNKKTNGYEWFKEDGPYKSSACIEDLIKDILKDIENAYKGER